MVIFKVFSTGATFFARNMQRHNSLRTLLPSSQEPRVAWMVGVGGGDEIELLGKRHNTGTKPMPLPRLAGINTAMGPAEPIEHAELAHTLSHAGPFEIHVLEVSPRNIGLAQSGPNEAQRAWVGRNIEQPSLAACSPMNPDRSPAMLRQYARDFNSFLHSSRSSAALAGIKYYHADAACNHPPTAPPDLIVCHNAFTKLNAASKIEPLIKALAVGGLLSLGGYEMRAFRFNPRQRLRYGLTQLAPGVFRKTRGPVASMPPAEPVASKLASLRSSKQPSGSRGGRRS